MANNVKITELTALTNPASSDVLPIVDIGTDTTKQVTIADLLENAGDGSAATPAFSFDNDNDTGIYRPGANKLAIATGGTNKLTIESSTDRTSVTTNFQVGGYAFTGRNDGVYIRPNGAIYASRTGGTNAVFVGYTTISDPEETPLATVQIKADGSASFAGSLTKGSGSFRIAHPLKPETHELVHSFVEGPRADNIYRGKVDLVAGIANVNIDTVAGMTEGTFTALNREAQSFASNETGWTAIKSSVAGNVLTITAQDNTCADTISWLVIGERQDQHMHDTDWTDDNGKVIVEPPRTS